jgi:tRNA uridine 5-carboxymethylaminomethyl modification enzyme
VLSEQRQQQRMLKELLEDLGSILHEKDPKGRRPTLEKVLRRPGGCIRDLLGWLSNSYPEDVLEQAEVEVKYAGYIKRQIRQARRLQKMEDQKIPSETKYLEMPGLSRELAEKLDRVRPATLGQASRVDGMTPAAMMVLSIWIKKTGNVPRGTSRRERP